MSDQWRRVIIQTVQPTNLQYHYFNTSGNLGEMNINIDLVPKVTSASDTAEI
jgi:hypothetical protein